MKMSRSTELESPWIFRLQIALLAGFSLFASAVVLWITRLIYISWVLQDVFSASIGIALVAVPVFTFLLIIINYVFWGLRAEKEVDKIGLQGERHP